MSTILLLSLALTTMTPTESAQHHARLALNGHYGPLEEWQRVGYQQLLREGVVWADAWVTTYYPSEGFPRGQGTRWGFPVDERCAAANELPAYSFIWIPGIGIRQVLDTGADSNDSVARRKGADHWLDLWVPNAYALGFTSEVRPVAAIPGRQSPKWKHGRVPRHAWLSP